MTRFFSITILTNDCFNLTEQCAKFSRNYLDPFLRGDEQEAESFPCVCSSVYQGQRVEAYRKARKLRYSEFPFREILRYPQSWCKSSRIGAR